MKESRRIDFIQSLRGIACISVIIYHARELLSTATNAGEDKILDSLGYFGVALFFIISGFIMTYTTKGFDRTYSYARDFFIKRFLRVWPVYVIATILSLILMPGMPELNDANNIIVLLKSILFIPIGDGNAPVFGFPTLVVGWTLNYEMLFYLIFGLSLFAGKARWAAFYFLTMTLLIVLPLSANGYFTLNPKQSYGYTSPLLMLATSPMIWLFVSGVIIGNVYSSRFVIKSKVACWHLILIGISMVLSQFVASTRIGHGVSEWGLTLIPMMLILCVASKTVDIKTPNTLIYLGNISYSMYLFHPLAQSISSHALVWMGLGDFSFGLQGLIISTAASVCLGSVSYFILEKRIGSLIKKVTSH